MKRALILTATLILILSAGSAEARPGTYQTDKGFGLGIMLGAPSGLSAKYFLDRNGLALAFGVGAYHEVRYDNGTEIHADVLWHPVALARTPSFTLPFYVGIGGRFFDHDRYYTRDSVYYDDHTHVGVRVPFGLAFDFKRAPMDLFFELVPVFDFVHERYDDRMDVTGAIGFRYYF